MEKNELKKTMKSILPKNCHFKWKINIAKKLP